MSDLQIVVVTWLAAGILAAAFAALRMNRRGWIAVVPLGLLAAGACVFGQYTIGTTSILGMPMPFAIFQLEEVGGRLGWIDYIGTPLALVVNAACGFGGALVVMSLATVLVPALRRRHA